MQIKPLQFLRRGALGLGAVAITTACEVQERKQKYPAYDRNKSYCVVEIKNTTDLKNPNIETETVKPLTLDEMKNIGFEKIYSSNAYFRNFDFGDGKCEGHETIFNRSTAKTISEKSLGTIPSIPGTEFNKALEEAGLLEEDENSAGN